MPKVEVPDSLSQLTGGARSLQVEPGTLAQIFEQLERKYPELYPKLVSQQSLRPFVRVFVNGKPVSLGADRQMSVQEEDSVRVLMAVAGG